MKKIFGVLFAVLMALAFISSGCSVGMAARQPDKKDLKVLKDGNQRDVVRAELGIPVDSGADWDTFSFIQGYSKGFKVIRVMSHIILDIASLGTWEIIGTPMEAIASGTKMVIRVHYKESRVAKVEYLKK